MGELNYKDLCDGTLKLNNDTLGSQIEPSLKVELCKEPWFEQLNGGMRTI